MMYITMCMVECNVVNAWVSNHSLNFMMQMTLVSVTFSGYIVTDAVFIVGFVMEKLEGNTLNSYSIFYFTASCVS